MLFEDLKFTIGEYNKNFVDHPDYGKNNKSKNQQTSQKEKPESHIKKSLTNGMSNEDIASIFKKMGERAKELNSKNHDYKIYMGDWLNKLASSFQNGTVLGTIIKDVAQSHNSNTGAKDLIEYAGLKFEVPANMAEIVCNPVGIDATISDTTFDKIFKNESVTVAESIAALTELELLLLFTFDKRSLTRAGINGITKLAQKISKKFNKKNDDDDDPEGGGNGSGGMTAATEDEIGAAIKKAINEAKAEFKRLEQELEAQIGSKDIVGEERFQKAFLEYIELKEMEEKVKLAVGDKMNEWALQAPKIKTEQEKTGLSFEEIRKKIVAVDKHQQEEIDVLVKEYNDKYQQAKGELLTSVTTALKQENENRAKVLEEEIIKKLQEANSAQTAPIEEQYNQKIKEVSDSISSEFEKKYEEEDARLLNKANEDLQQARQAILNMGLDATRTLELIEEKKQYYTEQYKNGAKLFLAQLQSDVEERMKEVKALEEEVAIKTSEIRAANEKQYVAEYKEKISEIREANKKHYQAEYTKKEEELHSTIQNEVNEKIEVIKEKYQAEHKDIINLEDTKDDLLTATKNFVHMVNADFTATMPQHFPTLNSFSGFQYNFKAPEFQEVPIVVRDYLTNSNSYVPYFGHFRGSSIRRSPNVDVKNIINTAKIESNIPNDLHSENFDFKFIEKPFSYFETLTPDKKGAADKAKGSEYPYHSYQENTRVADITDFNQYVRPLLGIAAGAILSPVVYNALQIAKNAFFFMAPRVATAGISSIVGGPVGIVLAAGMSIAAFKDAIAYATTHVSPIVLDLNGDGVKLYSYKEGVYFDYDNDHFAEKVGWISEDDGFLAIDKNGNGRIDNVAELFGNDFIPAFFKLSLMDSNKDNVIDEKDIDFNKLLVWQDKNKNGYSETDELKTLRELGIKSISLNRTKINKIEKGNIITEQSEFTYIDGRTHEAIDVLFENDDMDSQYVGDPIKEEIIKIPESVYKLPNINGFGVVTPLWISMSHNEYLRGLVESFMQLTPREMATVPDKAQEILYEWAGVSDLDDEMGKTATGVNIEWRKVSVIEKFSGQNFKQLGVAKFAGEYASASLNKAYLMILNDVIQNLLVQGVFKDIFPGAEYYGYEHRLKLNVDLDTVLSRAKDYINKAKSYLSYLIDEESEFWTQIGYILAGHKVELGSDITTIRNKIKEISGYEIYLGNNLFELVGDEFDNVIKGTSGSDVIKGMGGNDMLYGNGGDDVVEGGEGDDHIEGGEGNDRLYGNDGDDKIYGNEGRDFIYGGAGADTIEGGEGDDNIDGGSGADYLDGGEGTDTLSYGGSKSGVFVNLGTGEARGGDAEGDKFKNFENIGGSEYDDTLIGNDGDNHINGEGGDDKIYGGKGNDHLFGAKGNDEMYGEEGDDFITGFEGAEVIDGGPGIDTVSYHHPYAREGVIVNLGTGEGKKGHAEGDTYINIENIYGSRYDDILIGDDQDNMIFGYEGDDEIYGNGGDDVISGGPGHNKLYGEDGDDVFYLGEGSNQVDGGNGKDTVSYKLAKKSVKANLRENKGEVSYLIKDEYTNVENIIGSKHNDEIIGDDQDNKLFGEDGDDVIYGGGGNDIISGGKGADTIDGGDGEDWVDYGKSPRPVIVDLKAGMGKGGDAEGDTYKNIENVIGSGYNDKIVGDDKDNYLVGGDGDDHLEGGAGNDILVGGRGKDLLDGGLGIDTVSYHNSQEGVEVNLATGAGKGGDAEGDTYIHIERILGSKYNDIIIGSDTKDFLEGKEGDDTIYGGKGDDVITGGSGDNKLYGEGGNDLFHLGEGNNDVYGGSGQNTVSYKSYRTKEYESLLHIYSLMMDGRLLPSSPQEKFTLEFDRVGIKIDLTTGNVHKGNGLKDVLHDISHIEGSQFSDEIRGNDDDNYITGLNGNDVIWAGGGNDIIIAGEGTNIIYAGAGNDLIIGSPGIELVDGGEGEDSISYRYSTAGVQVNLETGKGHFGFAEGDKLYNIENVEGSKYDDVIYDNMLDNIISTGSGDDYIQLSHGDDTVHAGSGNDMILVKGAGNKFLFGGEDSDQFIFYPGFTTNNSFGVIILDFDTGDSQEKIDLSKISQVKSFESLNTRTVYKNIKNAGLPKWLAKNYESLATKVMFTEIEISNNQKISLFNIKAEALTADNFIFCATPLETYHTTDTWI
ncbi:iron-regulated protein frpC [Reticulomyxa filosa]|uniref:Iron-regulated protein frpC n=1 Tax=Reticulomyxa filosa TaxID=46433 RepID=X6MG59_RETFI|nr:iron-regulated protein frpC [Reticulomyxa filosa]|eukprot:ETO12377.1 iron-regulated protein frpC [Reticulomyxa filosa]